MLANKINHLLDQDHLHWMLHLYQATIYWSKCFKRKIFR